MTQKVGITLDADLLAELDNLVQRRVFSSRSGAIQAAVRDKLERLSRSRLATECAKLDPEAEQQLAEEGLGGASEAWPEY
jgi:Arc/MetJ-type ribon-helix-helix transcriptional regulator